MRMVGQSVGRSWQVLRDGAPDRHWESSVGDVFPEEVAEAESLADEQNLDAVRRR